MLKNLDTGEYYKTGKRYQQRWRPQNKAKVWSNKIGLSQAMRECQRRNLMNIQVVTFELKEINT